MALKEIPDPDSPRESHSHKRHIAEVAKFEGSFAPTARPGEHLPYPWHQEHDYFFGGWLDISIWRAAVIEAVGTSCLVFVSGHISTTLLGYGTAQLGAYIGISNVFLMSLFIYATAGLSGGHLNPMITFSAMFAGICPFSRGILYLCGQTLGAAVGGGVLSGVYGYDRAVQVHGGGCFYDPTQISTGQVFLNEIFASFTLLFLAYGVGLDPRQALLFGPRLGPVLVGSSLGLVAFASSGIAPGYAGAQLNPARCFAYGIARRDMTGQWIWWAGPAIAGLLLALIYNIMPPHGHDKAESISRTSLPVARPHGDTS